MKDDSDFLLLFTITLCVLSCPFTKVEESFNMQAISDLHQIGLLNLKLFDHLEFPGVVPRTFLGALVVYIFSLPIVTVSNWLNLSGRHIQVAIRLTVGFLSWLSFIVFKNGVERAFGRRPAQLTIVLAALQFHMCFYMSRTLPNTFALMLCLVAYGYWLRGSAYVCISVIAVAMVIFRCDLLVLMAPLVLQMLLTGEISFWKGLGLGMLVCCGALALTVAVDSHVWRDRGWLWPEGVVLLFNTVQNRSSEWGVMPPHWYFSNAIPKALNVSLLWCLCGAASLRFPSQTMQQWQSGAPASLSQAVKEIAAGVQVHRKLAYYLLPPLFFVLLYSILPHKELRFIFPALPLLTLGAAVGLDGLLPRDSSLLLYPLSLLHREEKKTDASTVRQQANTSVKRGTWWVLVVFRWAVRLALLGTLAVLSVLLSASHHNYPGGVALQRLIDGHLKPMMTARRSDFAEALASGRFEEARSLLHPIFVHIDVAAAMTGVTRFGQEVVSLDDTLRFPDLGSVNRHYNTDPSLFDYPAYYAHPCFRAIDDASGRVGAGYDMGEVLSVCGSVSLVFYSKEEGASQQRLDKFHFLLTEDPIRVGQNFHTAEEVKGFRRLRLRFPWVANELSTQMYIMINTATPLT